MFVRRLSDFVRSSRCPMRQAAAALYEEAAEAARHANNARLAFSLDALESAVACPMTITARDLGEIRAAAARIVSAAQFCAPNAADLQAAADDAGKRAELADRLPLVSL